MHVHFILGSKMESAYLSKIQYYKPLSKKKEIYYVLRSQKYGDRTAEQKVIHSNLRLVAKIAFEFQNTLSPNIMDLIQEGNIGLLLALKKFDIAKGVKFSTYATYWIRAHMFNFVMRNYSMVKIGTTQSQKKLFFNLRKEKQALLRKGIQPSLKRLSRSLQVNEKEIVNMNQRLKNRDSSLNEIVTDSHKEKVDVIVSPLQSPEQLVVQKEFQSDLHTQIVQFKKKLAKRELRIFEKRTIAEDPLSLQALGDEYGITRERVRQIESGIVNKLKIFLQQS